MVVSTALHDSVVQPSTCIPANRWVSGSLLADCWVQGDGASVPKWMRKFPWKSGWGSVGSVYNLGQPTAHGVFGWELFVCVCVCVFDFYNKVNLFICNCYFFNKVTRHQPFCYYLDLSFVSSLLIFCVESRSDIGSRYLFSGICCRYERDIKTVFHFISFQLYVF